MDTAPLTFRGIDPDDPLPEAIARLPHCSVQRVAAQLRHLCPGLPEWQVEALARLPEATARPLGLNDLKRLVRERMPGQVDDALRRELDAADVRLTEALGRAPRSHRQWSVDGSDGMWSLDQDMGPNDAWPEDVCSASE